MPFPSFHFKVGAITSILITLLLLILKVSTLDIFLFLIFFNLANWSIDTDHYIMSCIKFKKILSLKESYEYHANLMKYEAMDKTRLPGDFHIFHTLESHLLMLFMGLIYPIFYYIFLGMLLHSLTDICDLAARNKLYRRQFFLIGWFINGRKI